MLVPTTDHNRIVYLSHTRWFACTIWIVISVSILTVAAINLDVGRCWSGEWVACAPLSSAEQRLGLTLGFGRVFHAIEFDRE